MTKVGTYNGYDFYLKGACGPHNAEYNIVPEGSKAPSTGYANKGFIEHLKGVIFPAWYDDKIWYSMNLEEKIQNALRYNRVDMVERLQKQREESNGYTKET